MKLKIILIGLASALIAYSGFWFFLYLSTPAFLENAQKDLKNQGITINFSDYSIGGFPYRIVVAFEDFEFEFNNGPLTYKLSAQSLEAVSHPWSLGHFILFPETTFSEISLNQRKKLRLRPDNTSISFIDGREKGYRVSMVMEGVLADSTFEFPLPKAFETLSIHLRKEVSGPGDISPLLEPKLLEIALDGVFADGTGFNLLSSFRGSGVPPLNEAGLSEWRESGGTFEIETLQYHSPGGTILGSGSFTVDEKFYPLGSFGMEGVSNPKLIDFFHGIGLLTNENAAYLTDFLKTMPAGGTAEGFSLGLTAQGGVLTLGPVTLMEIESIIRE